MGTVISLDEPGRRSYPAVPLATPFGEVLLTVLDPFADDDEPPKYGQPFRPGPACRVIGDELTIDGKAGRSFGPLSYERRRDGHGGWMLWPRSWIAGLSTTDAVSVIGALALAWLDAHPAEQCEARRVTLHNRVVAKLALIDNTLAQLAQQYDALTSAHDTLDLYDQCRAEAGDVFAVTTAPATFASPVRAQLERGYQPAMEG